MSAFAPDHGVGAAATVAAAEDDAPPYRHCSESEDFVAAPAREEKSDAPSPADAYTAAAACASSTPHGDLVASNWTDHYAGTLDCEVGSAPKKSKGAERCSNQTHARPHAVPAASHLARVTAAFAAADADGDTPAEKNTRET